MEIQAKMQMQMLLEGSPVIVFQKYISDPLQLSSEQEADSWGPEELYVETAAK